MNEQGKADFWRNETIAFLALASIKGVGFWKLFKFAEIGLSFKDLLKAESAIELSKHLKVNLDIELPWNEYQVQLWNNGLGQARALNSLGIRLIFQGQEQISKIHLNGSSFKGI